MYAVAMAALGGMFTWSFTALGSAAVLLADRFSKKIINLMLGFSAGVMIAASFWALLLPSYEEAGIQGYGFRWVPVITGFAAGCLFLALIELAVPHIHTLEWKNEKGSASAKKSILLLAAMTMHNIPEGLAFGVLFGGASRGETDLAAALTLMLGIGIQNFPEGMALSVPLYASGLSRRKSFLTAQASALVEPVAAAVGAYLAMSIDTVMPYAMSFAAGAMIFVVVEELIPESQSGSERDNAASTAGAAVGFLVMTLMELAVQ